MPNVIAPTVDRWRSMTDEERTAFLVGVIEAFSDPRRAMSEGAPHRKAKGRALDLLSLHFQSMGRAIYLAEELAVLYPGEAAFVPDILAVVDVPQPEDDQRLAWVVAEEGRGLSFVLEVLHRGDRKKDLVDNVERYAHVGIPEYFVYDRARQQVHGYRLAGGGRYQRIVPQFGRYTSEVLGLDLGVQGGTLRFFQGMAELFGSSDLIGRLKSMVEDLEAKAEDAQAERESAQAERESAQARVDEALAGLRDGVLAVLSARGVGCTDEERARVLACSDAATLHGWLLRAATASASSEVFTPST
jgi:Uma2 family endonuclease